MPGDPYVGYCPYCDSAQQMTVLEGSFFGLWRCVGCSTDFTKQPNEVIPMDDEDVLVSDNEAKLFTRWFTLVQQVVHSITRSKGFWSTERNDGEMIALMHSELSEALEALRHEDPADKDCVDFSSAEVELADCIIRIMDMAEGRRLNVAGAVIAKLKYNATRAVMHGKKF